MHFTKTTGLALLALAASTSALAGTYSPAACTSHAVSIPCEGSAWDVGFEVFWAQASSDNQNYAFTTNSVGNLYDYHNVSADYDFGFELRGSLHFATGNDLTIRWERAHNSQGDSIEAHTGTTTLLTNYQVGSGAFFGQDINSTLNDDTRVDAKHRYEFDAINAEFGQHIDVGNDMDLRVHAGLQYASIEYTKALRYSTTGTRGSVSSTFDNLVEMESRVDAVGARVGADGAYNLGSGFSLVSHGSVSLLVGDVESQLRAFDDSAAIGTLASKQVVNFENDAVVIPAAMLKTGVNYGADLFDGHMSFEGGWRWEGYFNSMRFSPAAFAGSENFTFSGPYLAVSYVS